MKNKKLRSILLHLPAYREPELVPTIQDALDQATHPERLVFGVCRQYHPEDGFDDLTEISKVANIKVSEMLYSEAKGLPYARALINETLLEDEDFVLQLDAHHRFVEGWDELLLEMYDGLVEDGYNPVLTGYLPLYSPFNDPEGRTMEPWLQEPAAFYPHGTIFIRPVGIPNWQDLDKPVPSRFMSGHFSFGPNKWAKEIKHDTDIYFSGEELNLTVRTFTHGYDLFHPHKLVIWHATMREERAGKLAWDDQSKAGNPIWWKKQDQGRAKIRKLLRVEDNDFDLTGYDLGTKRTLRDYEKYAGIHFKKKSFQKYTQDRFFPPNPVIEDEKEWEDSFMFSFYHLVNVTNNILNKGDYSFILVAFDDEDGNGINTTYIDDNRIKQFNENGTPIHYEAMFLTEKKPAKVVFWGHSIERGWAERQEINL